MLVNGEVNSNLLKGKPDKDHKAQVRKFEERVGKAFEEGDLPALRRMFPEPIDLLRYRTTNRSSFYFKGSILHIAAFRAKKDFLEQFLNDYFPADSSAKNIAIKNKLLNIRNGRGKLATAAIRFLHVGSKAPHGEIYENYEFLKREILASWPKITSDDIHRLDAPTEGDMQKELPVATDFLIGKNLMWQGEVYPTIRLRNIPKDANDTEIYAEIKGIPLNAPDFLAEAKKQIDFPEDYKNFDYALNNFAKSYQEIKNDPGKLAAYRFFTANNGIVIIESGQDPLNEGNSKEGIGYAGYASCWGQPFIVLTTYAAKTTLTHELFHQVDLHTGVIMSKTDLCKAVFMLSDGYVHNQWIFNDVDRYYGKTSEYELEAFARIMELSDEQIQSDPLLHKLHKIGKKIAMAKADDMPAIENRIAQALMMLPKEIKLRTYYNAFMHVKELKYAIAVDEIAKTYINENGEQKTELVESEEKVIFEQEKQKFDESIWYKRGEYAAALADAMDNLLYIIEQIEKAPKEVQQVIVPYGLLRFGSNYIYGNEQAIFNYKIELQKQMDTYAEDKNGLTQMLIDKMAIANDPLEFSIARAAFLDLSGKADGEAWLRNEYLEEGSYYWAEDPWKSIEDDKSSINEFKRTQKLFNDIYPNKDMPMKIEIGRDGVYLPRGVDVLNYIAESDNFNKPSFETAMIISDGFTDSSSLYYFNQNVNYSFSSSEIKRIFHDLDKDESNIEILSRLGTIQSCYKDIYGKDTWLPKEITLSGLTPKDFEPAKDGIKPIIKTINFYQEKLKTELDKHMEQTEQIGNTNITKNQVEEFKAKQEKKVNDVKEAYNKRDISPVVMDAAKNIR